MGFLLDGKIFFSVFDGSPSDHLYICTLVSDIAIFVLKRDVKLQLTNLYLYTSINSIIIFRQRTIGKSNITQNKHLT